MVTSKTGSSTTPTKQADFTKSELPITRQQNLNDTSSTSMSADPTCSDASIKKEQPNEEDTNANTASTDTSVEMEDYIVRPRRCGRLQKEEVLNQHDPDVCPLGES